MNKELAQNWLERAKAGGNIMAAGKLIEEAFVMLQNYVQENEKIEHSPKTCSSDERYTIGDKPYYLEGKVIHKSPVERKKPDGGLIVICGFPVCTVGMWVDPEHLLSIFNGEDFDKLKGKTL